MFKCYLCGNNSAEVVADKKNIRFNVDCEILRCLKCDLIQMFPQKEPFYDGYGEKKDFKGHKRKVRVSKYLTKHIHKFGGILEVGCGDGDNIEYLNGKGFWHTLGVDKSTKYGLRTDYRNLWSPHKFNVIYAIHFLEHVADPIEFLIWVVEHLNDDGKFIFEVPSVDDPLIKLYKNNAYDKFCWYPYHMFFYSKKTLAKLFDGLNVKIIRRQEYGIVNHLRWLFKGKPGNWNPHIPIIDDIYKFVLKRFGYSDSLVVVGHV